jgi:predicted nucleotidyltransferase component of viral defense system
MKDYLTQIVRAAPDPVQGRNIAREYLQARILGSLQQAGAMIPLAFHGGTALRFLFASARYSEDLDFALEQGPAEYNFRAYLQAIRSTFTAEGYQVELKVSDQKTVQNAFVRFRGLLYELDLSPHRDEVLAVKIEMDTNPPPGTGLVTSIVRRYVILQLQHHDQASLLAGKLHAILQRTYIKGRDIYDLLWYFSDRDWPAPNLTLLNNALQQTDWADEPLTGDNWRRMVRQRLRTVDWEQVVADVRPFLEPGVDPGIMKLENLMRVLEQKEGNDPR